MAKKTASSKPKVTKKKAIRPKAKRSRRSGVYALLALSFLVLFFFWSLEPTQNWLRQKREMALLNGKISAIERENRSLDEEKVALSSLERIERLARKDLGLVKPGEEAYVVVPPLESSKPSKNNVPPERKEPSLWQTLKRYVEKL